MTELVEFCAAALLLTAVLTVWRRPERAVIRILAVQGAALAALVAVVGFARADAAAIPVVVLVLALKAVILPWVLSRRLRRNTPEEHGDEAPLVNPVAALVATAVLSVAAYVLTWPTVAGRGGTAHVAPVGFAMVLIGFLILASRRRALSQLVGFLVLDNGIATVAFLVSGGVPLLLEFGASLDVLLALLILQVFTRQMHATFGNTDVDRLRKLHD